MTKIIIRSAYLNKMKFPTALIYVLMLSCVSPNKVDHGQDKRTIGKIIVLESDLSRIIPDDAKIEVLAVGLNWSEGPLWVEEGKYLLFSDVPENSIFKWKEGEGKTLYLKPSGYTDRKPRNGEPCSNGLLLTFYVVIQI